MKSLQNNLNVASETTKFSFHPAKINYVSFYQKFLFAKDDKMFSNQANVNELLQLCAKADPNDLPLVDLLLANIDCNQQISTAKTPLLAQIIQNFSKFSPAHTFLLPEYISLFIKHGFDAVMHSASCLRALLESVPDENLLTAADLLIAHGSSITPEELKQILSDISQIAAYHEFNTHNYYLQNLFFAYRQLLINTFTPTNPRYAGITHYTHALHQPLKNIYYNSLEHSRKHLYFNFSNGILIVQNHPNFYMCSAIESSLAHPTQLNLHIASTLNNILKEQYLENISFSYTKIENYDHLQYFPAIHMSFSQNLVTISRNKSSNILDVTIDGKKV